MDPRAQVVHLKTQLVSQRHTRFMLAETDLMTLRIHCYAPGIGENALHAHTKEDPIFVVLEGTAQFNERRQDGANGDQEPRGGITGGQLLSVLQFRPDAAGGGAHRRGIRQSGPTAQSRWFGDSRQNPRTRSGKAGADRGRILRIRLSANENLFGRGQARACGGRARACRGELPPLGKLQNPY